MKYKIIFGIILIIFTMNHGFQNITNAIESTNPIHIQMNTFYYTNDIDLDRGFVLEGGFGDPIIDEIKSPYYEEGTELLKMKLDNDKIAQSFTATNNRLTKLGIFLNRSWEYTHGLPIIVEIRKELEQGWLFAITVLDLLSYYGDWEYFRNETTDYTLDPGETYYITVSPLVDMPLDDEFVAWWYGVGNPYPDGFCLASIDGGENWIPNPYWDLDFQIWGYSNVSVSTEDATGKGMDHATLNGKIIDDGGHSCEVRFKIRESGSDWWFPSDWSGSHHTDEEFSEVINNLESGIIYEFQAGARNEFSETIWGEILSFQTSSPGVPSCITKPADNIKYTKATLHGRVEDYGGDTCLWKFQIREIDETWTDACNWHSDFSNDCFFLNKNNLEPAKQYRYRAVLMNSYGTGYGEERSFITDCYFIHITDIHIGTSGASDRFQYIVQEINKISPPPQFVIISGDLTHWGTLGWGIDSLADWITFFIIADQLNMPYYVCAGNHDHLGIGGLIYPYLYTFESQSFSPVEILHTLSLDSGGFYDYIEGWIDLPLMPFPIPIIDWIPEGPGLSSDQINWLNNNIDNYPDTSKIIFMHHPVVCTTSIEQYPGEEETNGCIVFKRENFMDLCRNKNVELVIGGHIHDSFEYTVSEEDDPIKLSSPSYYDCYGKYWNAKEMSTMYVITGAASQWLKYRNIIIDNGNKFKVYQQDEFEWYDGLAQYHTDLIPWDLLPGGNISTNESFESAGRLHVYDSIGQHVGITDNRSIDLEIPGAYYEDEPILIEGTTEELMNWSSGELINLMLNDSDSYIFEIDVFINSSLNLSGEFHAMNRKGEFNTYYLDIPVYRGTKGKLEINNDKENYILYLDDDGDGIIDREILPTYCDGNRAPKKPHRPTGPTRGWPFIEHWFTTNTSDTDYGDHDIYYKFDFDDDCIGGDSTTDWIGPFSSGENVSASVRYKWHLGGETYKVRVKAIDDPNGDGNLSDGIESDWSEAANITITFFGPPGGSCFLEKTKIVMNEGSYKSIEDIKVGDIVKSYNLLNSEIEPAIVTKVHHHKPEMMTEYYLIINNNLRVTPNHLLYVNGKLREIGNVKVGDILGFGSSSTSIVSIEKVYEQVSTYNFEIVPVSANLVDDVPDSYSTYMVCHGSIGEMVPAYPYKPGSYEVDILNQMTEVILVDYI